ncbi:hypothetical protein V6N13_059303 [Hibiscus sabdariffa]|uniref:Uncharacterized protein n=1 Tax=Hibiscus sabdariffa TaxID=183260 RepID=A0ABR2GDG7_9ROSI
MQILPVRLSIRGSWLVFNFGGVDFRFILATSFLEVLSHVKGKMDRPWLGKYVGTIMLLNCLAAYVKWLIKRLFEFPMQILLNQIKELVPIAVEKTTSTKEEEDFFHNVDFGKAPDTRYQSDISDKGEVIFGSAMTFRFFEIVSVSCPDNFFGSLTDTLNFYVLAIGSTVLIHTSNIQMIYFSKSFYIRVIHIGVALANFIAEKISALAMPLCFLIIPCWFVSMLCLYATRTITDEHSIIVFGKG